MVTLYNVKRGSSAQLHFRQIGLRDREIRTRQSLAFHLDKPAFMLPSCQLEMLSAANKGRHRNVIPLSPWLA